MHTHRRPIAWLILAAFAGIAAGAPGKPPQAPKPAPATSTAKASSHPALALIDSALAQLDAGGDFETAGQSIELAWNWLVVNQPIKTDKEIDALASASESRRLVSQLQRYHGEDRPGLYRLLRASPKLRRALCMQVRPENDPAGVYRVLSALRGPTPDAQRDALLERYAHLVAAICVVHDRPFTREINEQTTTPPPPAEILAYFLDADRAGKLQGDARATPTELLMYVVDTGVSVAEMRWALEHYGHDVNIANRYSEVPYDTSHFYSGAPKKLTGQAYTLETIKRVGGICADQAHYAMSVGKALGIPTAYVTGADAQVGHAWLGFMRFAQPAGWNFDTGRYEEYRHVRGGVIDPQTRKSVSDAHLCVMSSTLAFSPEVRARALALTDAAESSAPGADLPVAPIAPPNFTLARRPVGAGSAAEFLDAALRRCTGTLGAWALVEQLAEQDQFTPEQLTRLDALLENLCANRYPEFAADVRCVVGSGIRERRRADAFFDAAVRSCGNRTDLVAQVRYAQAQYWSRAGDQHRAVSICNEIVDRHITGGRAAIDALWMAGQSLTSDGRPREATELYARAYYRLPKPSTAGSSWMYQSNWYHAGYIYYRALLEDGRERDAEGVRLQLGIAPERVTPKAAPKK